MRRSVLNQEAGDSGHEEAAEYEKSELGDGVYESQPVWSDRLMALLGYLFIAGS